MSLADVSTFAAGACPAPGSSRDERVVGLKIALTSEAAQRRLGSAGPVWGWLTAGMQVPSGAAVLCRGGYRTRAEAELVFVLGDDLVGPGLTRYDVLAATAAICPGLEVPANARADRPLTVAEFVHSNAGAYRFVLGNPRMDWRQLDLELLGVLVEADGLVVSSGAGAAVLGHPADAIAQVANALADSGRELRAGEFVFAGGLADAVELEAGRCVEATFAHLGHVAVSGL